MNRLSNVSANPAGKFGAPEAEPVPVGVASSWIVAIVDSFVRIELDSARAEFARPMWAPSIASDALARRRRRVRAAVSNALLVAAVIGDISFP
jgi:hypothetical protein